MTQKESTGEPRKHHYVPRFLLKNFSIDKRAATPQLFVFDKKSSRSFKTSISNICAERDFYRFEIADQSLSAEDMLGRIETEAAPVIETIIRRATLAELSTTQKEALILFIALQQTRSVGNRARFEDFGRQMQQRLARNGAEAPFAADENQKKLSAIKLSFGLLKTQIQAFDLKTKVLFKNETGKPLLIGDEPLVLHNQKDTAPYGNLGIMCPGIEIYIPISPNLMLGLWCPSHRQSIADGVRKYQKLKTLAILGSSRIRKSATEDLVAGKDAFDRLLGRLNNIDTNRCLSIDSENVDFFNSLQIMHAERYIMSCENDFTLTRQMIASNDKFRRGMRFEIM